MLELLYGSGDLPGGALHHAHARVVAHISLPQGQEGPHCVDVMDIGDADDIIEVAAETFVAVGLRLIQMFFRQHHELVDNLHVAHPPLEFLMHLHKLAEPLLDQVRQDPIPEYLKLVEGDVLVAGQFLREPGFPDFQSLVELLVPLLVWNYRQGLLELQEV